METREMTSEKRPVGRPATGTNEMIAIRWPRWLLDAIDRYGRDQMLERPVALRQIVTKYLAEQGIVDADAVFPGRGRKKRARGSP